MEAIHGKKQEISLDFGQNNVKNIPVEVPAGIEDGQQLIVSNAAKHGNMTVSLVVHVRAHLLILLPRHVNDIVMDRYEWQVLHRIMGQVPRWVKYLGR